MISLVSHSMLPHVGFERQSPSDFTVFENQTATALVLDQNDSRTVHAVARLFANDIKQASCSACMPEILFDLPSQMDDVIIVGTCSGSALIHQLAESGIIDIAPIENGWEQYLLQVIDNPYPNIRKALVIAGSDRRGVAYGLFGLSEAMGISPFVWWTDVPVEKKTSMYLYSGLMLTRAPSVRYRGIFINDEDWGLIPWAAQTYDPECGNIGPKTYARVCELLLRLGANMLAPAMHSISDTFFSHQENADVLDEYGIVLTASHCEPLLFNNASEWSKEKNGEWNYLTNKSGITDVLARRVRETRGRECVYPLAMRGIHDSGIVGVPKDQQAKITESAMLDQRGILSHELDTPAEKIPQIFVPYKEVMDLYEEGLAVPDDVTIVWADDNYGYMKRLAMPEERKRSGRFGVYYHVSYLGSPHDYIWLATTHPALIYEEMNKAYITGADRYWLLNVGDIKPQEMQMYFFLNYARDVDAYTQDRAGNFPVEFYSKIFGRQYESMLADIVRSYFSLSFTKKPEMMGGGMTWNEAHFDEILWDTGFSFSNFNEAQKRIAAYKTLVSLADGLYRSLPEILQPAFDELILYQVRQSANLNLKMLYAELSRIYARQFNPLADTIADLARFYQGEIQRESERIHGILNGKWNHFFSIPVVTEMPPNYSKMPPVGTVPEDFRGFYYEQNRYVSIECGRWHRKHETGNGVEICSVDFLSPFGKALQFRAHPDVPAGDRYSDLSRTPCAEYDFVTTSSGHAIANVYVLPTFPFHPGRLPEFAVAIDDLYAQFLTGIDREYSGLWNSGTLCNFIVCRTPMYFPILKPGRHTFKIYCMTPCMVFQKVVVSFGEVPDSCLGPDFTKSID